jgi:hypothetical protein
MGEINTLPMEGWAYKITDRPCGHHKDGRHKGDCSVCVREVLVEANAAVLAKLDTANLKLKIGAQQIDGLLFAAEEAARTVRTLELQVDELRHVIWSLDLFVGVYEGRALDKARAEELIRKHGRRSEKSEGRIVEVEIVSQEHGKPKIALDETQKRIEEPPMECSSCHKVSADVQPYCSGCYMDV